MATTRKNAEIKLTPTKKSTRAKKAETEKSVETPATEEEKAVDKRDDEIAMLKEQIRMLTEQMANASKPQVVTIAGEVEKVFFLWQAPVADDNVVTFGENGLFGRITGKTGTFYVPKSDLSRIMDAPTRHYLDLRWLIVLSGLTEEEKEAYGVNYKPGEILDKGAFSKLTEIGDEILKIFPNLCESHKEIVAKLYREAYVGGKKPKRETVLALSKMSKSEAFKSILEDMNAKELEK